MCFLISPNFGFLLRVCDERLNDLRVLGSSLLVSLLLFLICTVDIKHTKDGGEDVIAPRSHSTWLYMDNSPPENKQNIYLYLFLHLPHLLFKMSGEEEI